MTAVYLAGPYSHRAELLDRANELVAASNGRITITSTWLQGEHEAKEGHASLEEMAGFGVTNIKDIDACDTLIQFVEWPSTTGAAHMEYQRALWRGKFLIVCGPHINIFHAKDMWYGETVHAEHWADAKAYLLEIAQ